jgi:hypothetical protein
MISVRTFAARPPRRDATGSRQTRILDVGQGPQGSRRLPRRCDYSGYDRYGFSFEVADPAACLRGSKIRGSVNALRRFERKREDDRRDVRELETLSCRYRQVQTRSAPACGRRLMCSAYMPGGFAMRSMRFLPYRELATAEIEPPVTMSSHSQKVHPSDAPGSAHRRV